MAYVPRFDRISSYRLDGIVKVKPEEVCPEYSHLAEAFERMRPHLWGVSTQGRSGERLEHAEFTVRFGEDEGFILDRLEREKRCGTVERIDGNTARFSVDVYDSAELVPWIRTFICRITDFRFSDEGLQKQFADDIEAMCRLYGVSGEGGGEG